MRPLYFFKTFLFLNLLILTLSQPTRCPWLCTCLRNSVGCVRKGYSTVPQVPAETHALDLRYNKFTDLPPGAFSGLRNLRSLLLNDNQLRTLRTDMFHGLKRVKYLYLYRNRIKHIEHDVFAEMKNLEQLYLQVNEIHQIQPETFSNMPRMGRLYLHSNRLKRIPFGAFVGMPKLHKLRLDGNALMCDCQMKWFVMMLAEHQSMSVLATCYGPEHAMGASLATMKEEDFKCKSPEIKIEPDDAIVRTGDDALFNCVALGDPTPEIVWLRDSVALPLHGSRYQVGQNGTLMVHDAGEEDTGVFECMAININGEVRSRRARMTIDSTKEAKKTNKDSAPFFVVLPQKQFISPVRKLATLDCQAKGDPKPRISWLFNGERLVLNERMDISNNGTIFIYNPETADVGEYTCVAKNIHGRITVSVTLEIMGAPAFTTVPKDATVVLGDQVVFTCKARGSPKPVITWYRNTLDLSPSNNLVLSDNNQTLTILEVTTDDEGLYHCRAENMEGLTEISAVLKIDNVEIIPPRIVLKAEDTDAFKGTTVLMPCEVESESPASIEWSKDGSRLAVNDRISITIIGSLIINNLTVLDTGRYECSVFNEYGRDTASVFLTVKDHVLPGDEYVNIALTQAARDVDQAIAKTVDELFSNNKTSNNSVSDLYRIVRFPNAPAREVARAAEVYERTLYKVKDYVQSGLSITSANPFTYENILSGEHLDIIARLSGCVAHREERDCSDMCYHSKYRSLDGSCNNFAHSTWGASLTGFRRILFPLYENGFSQPIGWNKDKEYNGFKLPLARLVSTTIISTTLISQDVKVTHMVMQWGQWLDHDLDHALPSVSSQTWDGVDCKKTCDYAPPCFPMDVPENDPRINNRRCIDFIRTSAVCGSGMTSAIFGRLQPREQINQLTSFIDASQVYGFEKSVAEDLRDLTNDNGLLRVGATFPGKKPLLPTIGINGMDCRRNLDESNRECFVAGDIRANEQIGLAAMHTIWMREHNRLASELKALNPFWDGDRAYQEARKVVGAEIQYITYEHWLPLVLGPEGYEQLGRYTGYDSELNPSISNVFATAALRFGHSMINPILHRYDEHFETIPQGHLLLRDAFFAPWRLVDEGGVDPLLRGMFMTPAKLKTPTQNLNSELTEKLFYATHAVALDLAAINIQRGRDHAIPSYTKWRQVCNMSEVNDFDDLADEISDEGIRDKLKELYGSVHNIDVWVGGILENQVEGGKVGPLFRCLLVEQFKRLREGDRFWYENPSVFKSDQLKEIKRTSLARVLCDNGDNIDTIGENVFLLPDEQDGLISCDDLPSIDLRYWVDCESCAEDNDRAKRSTRSVQLRQGSADRKPNRDRMDNLEIAQNDLVTTIHSLKHRIEVLEKTCWRV